MPRGHLALKLIGSVAGFLVVAMAIFGYVNITTQREQLMSEMRQNAIGLGETVHRSLRSDMLGARRERVQQIVESIAEQEDIREVRVLDKEARIMVSADRAQIGEIANRQDPSCSGCHAAMGDATDTLSVPLRTWVSEAEDGSRLLTALNPIYNEHSCSNASCHAHPEGQRVLGVLDIVLSLDRLDAQIRENRGRMILQFLVIFCVISVAIGGLAFLFVNIPIKRLLEGTRRVAGGDLAHHIPVRGNDELAELGQSFNEMTEDLKTSRDEIEEWNRELERKVQIAAEELDRANQRFVRTVEHELRSPLGAIQSCLNVALEPSVQDQVRQDMVARAQRRSISLLHLVNELLDLSYLKSEKTRYNMVPVHLAPLFEELADSVSPQAADKGLMMQTLVPHDLPPVKADRQGLERVFTNLMSNALRYTPAGGSVRVRAKLQETRILVQVSDTGIGIPEKHLPHIFEEFHRADNAKAHTREGTGLGLAIVKEIVEGHDGEIRVESVLDKGTTFFVYFPTWTEDIPPEVDVETQDQDEDKEMDV